MKLIYNMVTIPVKEDKYIVINTLNGLIDEIDKPTHDILHITRVD